MSNATKLIGVHLHPGAVLPLKQAALARGVTLSALVRAALSAWWASQPEGAAGALPTLDDEQSPAEVAFTPPGEKRSSRSMPSASTREIGKKGGEEKRSSEGATPPPARKGAKAKGRG